MTITKRGRLELLNEDCRAQVKEGLQLLWDAMRLSAGPGGLNPNENWDDHYRLYKYIGETLLGEKSCPEWEILQ